jgi:hypothetical protein
MSPLFASGAIVDLLLALLAAEALLLAIVRHWSGRGPPLRALLASLLAGAGLLLALRAALAGAPWQTTASWLATAFAAHLWDLGQRWPRRSMPENPSGTRAPGGVE